MAPKLHPEPLTSTVREQLRKQAEERNQATLLTMKRKSPPTANGGLPVVGQPEKPREPEKVPKKGAKIRRYTPEFKAKAVARGLKAKENGETILSIAADLGTDPSNIHNWIRAAKQQSGAGRPGKGDLRAVTSELEQALANVARLKSKLRKMLGDD